jgi:hypothetical protein
MAAEDSQPVDLWDVLDEAEATVETWPAWQQRYEADVFQESGDSESLKSSPEAVATRPA